MLREHSLADWVHVEFFPQETYKSVQKKVKVEALPLQLWL